MNCIESSIPYGQKLGRARKQAVNELSDWLSVKTLPNGFASVRRRGDEEPFAPMVGVALLRFPGFRKRLVFLEHVPSAMTGPNPTLATPGVIQSSMEHVKGQSWRRGNKKCEARGA
jgi:hypothetical protein